jgi:hypothetical protein
MHLRQDPPPSGCYWPRRPGTEILALYEERLASFQDRVAATLGSHTARVLLDRAIWQAAQCHPALDLIHHDDSGLSFEALETSCATRPEEEIAVAFNDLVTEMLLILSRLLGRDIAERICADAHL